MHTSLLFQLLFFSSYLTIVVHENELNKLVKENLLLTKITWYIIFLTIILIIKV